MSLLDLRKNSTPSSALKCTVDEFIDSAQSYARGFDRSIIERTMIENDIKALPLQQPPKLPFRKATFTLSEPCIDALSKLAEQSGFAKSHLIRILIHQFEEASTIEQQQMLNRHKNKD